MTAADIHAIFGDMTIQKVAAIVVAVFVVCAALALFAVFISITHKDER